MNDLEAIVAQGVKVKLKSLDNTAGYRDVSVLVEVDQGKGPEQLTLKFSKDDAFEIMSYILNSQKLAWSGDGPDDKEHGESMPDVLYLLELRNRCRT